MPAAHPETHLAMPIPAEALATFRIKWKLSKLELFGSVLRDDFRADRHVDVLITSQAGEGPTFLGIFAMRDELQTLFQRPVDLLTRESIEASRNALRRNSILDSAVVVYAK